MHPRPIAIHLPDTDMASYIAPLLDNDFDPYDVGISDIDASFDDDDIVN